MSRLVRLTTAYARGARRLGVHRAGTRRRRVAAATALPLPGDVEGLIPPVFSAYVHRVDGERLWLWYTATDSELVLRALTDTPPV